MPPRPMWKGHLKLSLVTFGVRLYPATDSSEKIRFNYLHRDCGHRLKQQLRCPVHGDVERKEMVKGYEFQDGRYIAVEQEELKRLEAAASRTIEIDQFVEQNDLEPIYLDRPYYLGPDGKVAEHGYHIMHDAIKRTRKIGIGRMVLGGAERIVALQVEGKGFRLTTLHPASEIRNSKPYFEDVESGSVDAKQLKLAEELIQSITGPLDTSKFVDQYQAKLRAFVEAKVEGEADKVLTAEEEEEPATFNFLEALRASVGQLEGKPAAKRKKPGASKSRSNASSKSQPQRRRRKAG